MPSVSLWLNFKSEVFQRTTCELDRLGEILRPKREAAQADFVVEKIKRVRCRVRRERRVTTAAERRLKRPLKRHETKRSRIEDTRKLRDVGRTALHGDRGLADRRHHVLEAERVELHTRPVADAQTI